MTVATLVVVPFRHQAEFDRDEHLRALKQYLFDALDPRRDIVVVAEQSADGRGFNRGQLLNLGFLYCVRTHGMPSAVCLHDVDLTVDNPHKQYHARVAQGPLHIASAYERYRAPTYCGGILLLDPGHFQACNGFPNGIFGWGGEDDALRHRLLAVGLRHRGAGVRVYDQERSSITGGPLTRDDKLAMLREAGAKCPDKRERVAADRVGVAWMRDGLNTARVHVTKKTCGHLLRGGSEETGARVDHVVFALDSALPGVCEGA